MGAISHILTPAEILARLLTVDGAASLLDADLVDGNDSAALLGAVSGRSAKTGTYTVIASDRGKVIDCTSGTFSVALTAAATLGTGFAFAVYNSGSGTITVDPNSTETIRSPNGSSTTLALTQGMGAIIYCDGSGFLALGYAQPTPSAYSPTGLLGALDLLNTVSITTTTTVTNSGKNKTHICSGTSADYTVTVNSSGFSTGDTLAFEVATSCNRFITISAGTDIGDFKMWAGETVVLRWTGSVFRKIGGHTVPLCYKLDGTTSQTISDDTETKVTAFDTLTVIAPSSNYPAEIGDAANHKLKTGRAALLRIKALVVLSPGANTLAYGSITVKVAGTKVIGSVRSSTTTTGYITLECDGYYLATNTAQDIEVYVLQKSGESRDVNAVQASDVSTRNCELWVQEVPVYTS